MAVASTRVSLSRTLSLDVEQASWSPPKRRQSIASWPTSQTRTRVQFTDEFITSLKKGKGSPMEACLASRAIGLLAITVGNGSTVKEIMQQSLPHLEKVVSSESEALKIFALDCLATTTFWGANNWEETEKSMEIMWDII